jgi:hypothetical protein
MPKVSYTHHWTNESEADAQAVVREGLARQLKAVGGGSSRSVGFEYRTDENGERFIEGWQPYRISGPVSIPQPVIQSPIVVEPEVPQIVCEQCSQVLQSTTIRGANRRLTTHMKREHN